MANGGIGIAIDLDQYEAGGIGGLADDVEPRDAGFQYAVSGVLKRGGYERVFQPRLNLNINVNNVHNVSMIAHAAGA